MSGSRRAPRSGGSAAHATATAAGDASGSHPAAFAAVFLPMAGVALIGAWVTTRLRER
ncbi:hypothetical protein [Streptomyces sp. HUAS TT20]|uniref:hypothetical protein n=1 Tax=Streptomyces sp. HUAS TT20 TaxID=3447509 RepID=UPI0021D94AC3|nr:hypothetical protein [Streptomyces sp. HUAS 15-9]UXY32916.1 hypothetical protein N8I87_15675 [Streptomyces sp. HUAS 15-9]